MQHPGGRLCVRTTAARTQDRLLVGHDLGLHKQIGECGVSQVGGGGGEDHFGVARQLEHAVQLRAVGERHPADFDIILG